ncbi:two-component system OmpR family sensor kinase [Actinoplanes tereljensis]|uniref:histidine kinase n=1 Tax=Paractinoplanes tereljensis TaxID=571912 RepID=A0A919NYV0_9ACTN|nr:HAMP domain-containing sensor histidine kinase [Actinoplanes tereljensis]GIF26760.1 two-component sensor histidine kinase [Actinoplanes tereljensis]
MTESTTPTTRAARLRAWRPRRWAHWTVRSRLAVTMVIVCGCTLLAVNVVGTELLRSYLADRLDGQLDRIGQTSLSSRALPDSPRETAVAQRLGGLLGAPINVGSYDASGQWKALLTSPEFAAPVASFASVTVHADRGPYTVTAGADAARWRIIAVTSPDGGFTTIALSLQEIDATVDRMLLAGLLLSVFAIILVAAVAVGVVRVGLRPLTRMQDTAAAIAAGSIMARVADTDPHTEPGRLGIALNTMLARIGDALAYREATEQRLRQFLADVSHELRTPLTSVRGFAELYRRGGAATVDELDATMLRIEQEATRMTALVEDLLLLSALDEDRTLELLPTDLTGIAADAARDAQARHPGRVITLDAVASAPVRADEYRLRQVATNLVANAIAHTPADTRIAIRVRYEPPPPADPVVAIGQMPGGPLAVLEVSDNGPGIPVEHAPHIFERMYRTDPSRGRKATADGSGLGLSIVAAIVTAHAGRIELLRPAPHGATFRVLLPADPTLLEGTLSPTAPPSPPRC